MEFSAEWISAALLWSGAIVMITLGVIGLVFPAIPGPPLLFGGLWMAAWIEDYVHVGLGTLIALGALALLGVIADFIAGALGAKKFGASGLSVFGATLGAIVGIFFGIIGLLLGPFIGAVIGELMSGRTVDAAGRAGIGATIGLLIGTAAKLAVGIMMLGLFLFMRLS